MQAYQKLFESFSIIRLFFGKNIFDIIRYITIFIAIYVMQQSEVTKNDRPNWCRNKICCLYICTHIYFSSRLHNFHSSDFKGFMLDEMTQRNSSKYTIIQATRGHGWAKASHDHRCRPKADTLGGCLKK